MRDNIVRDRIIFGVGLLLLLLACFWLGNIIVFGGDRVEACADCLRTENGGSLYLDSEFCLATEDQWTKKITTVRKELRWRGAYCKNGIIYDWRGREIRFYEMSQPYGPRVSPEMGKQKAEQMEADRKITEEMEKHYTVIRMYSTHYPV